MGRVFDNGPRDRGSIRGRVRPMTQNIALDASLLNTQHCKVRIKGKCCVQGKEYCLLLHLDVVTIEKEDFGLPSTTVTNITYT